MSRPEITAHSSYNEDLGGTAVSHRPLCCLYQHRKNCLLVKLVFIGDTKEDQYTHGMNVCCVETTCS